jgi:hypothetical protein
VRIGRLVDAAQRLTSGVRIAIHTTARAIHSMLRIVRSIDAGTTTLTVSGRVGSEQLPTFRRLVEEELTGGVVLDLAEVSLVDVETVRFLAQCETKGVRIANCPAYVREWMVREQ